MTSAPTRSPRQWDPRVLALERTTELGLMKGTVEQIVDSTPMLAAAATQDTVTLVRSAVAKLVGAVGAADEQAATELAEGLDFDYERPRDKPDSNWRSKAEREAMLTRVAEDAERALRAVEGAEGLLAEEAVDAAHHLLRELIGQDFYVDSDGTPRHILMETMEAIDRADEAKRGWEPERIRRGFRIQAAAVLAVVVGLTAIHFLLVTAGLDARTTDALFLVGLIAAAGSLLFSIRFVERETGAAFGEINSSYVGSITALQHALDHRDGYTGEHSKNVVDRAVRVGERMGMSRQELDALVLGALLHDIGKIGIPDSILHKPGPLTDKEWVVMRRHPVIGAEILAPLAHLHDVIPTVRHEHERWDGNGYPDGLAGKEIPLSARIIFVCDAYDAMTTDRPYRDALPTEEAVRRLREGAGTQFDPDVTRHVIAAVTGVTESDVEPSGREGALGTSNRRAPKARGPLEA